MRRRFKLAGAALLCFFVAQHGVVAQKKQAEPALPQVRLSDVPEKAEIIGRLGVPIAEIVDVKGRWVKLTEKPDNFPWFTVTEVNGRTFDVPLLFRADSVKPVHSDVVKKIEPKEGDVWEMRGIEVCDYKGMPENVRKELGFPRVAQRAVGLVSRFEYVRAQMIADISDKPGGVP